MSNQNRRSTRNNKRSLEDVIQPVSIEPPSLPSNEDLAYDNNSDPFLRIPKMFPYKYFFKYLNGEDILNLSEVSNYWYNVTARSSTCMSKLKIFIDFSKLTSKCSTPPTPTTYQILKGSLRNYQNIDFSCQHNKDYSEECLDLINCHQESMKEITIREMSEVNLTKYGNMWLPKLQSLKIKGTNESSCSQIFKLCCNLEVLHMDTNYDKFIIDWLLKNPNLKELKFSNDIFESLFRIKKLVEFPFKLTKFTSLAWKTDVMTEYKFIKFLAKHMYSLKELKLFHASHNMVEFIYNELERLKVIDIKYFDNCRAATEVVEPIPNRIEIIDMNLHHNILVVGVRAMIKAAPELRVLRMKFINQSVVEFVAVFCKKLRVLVYCYDVDRCQEHYKTITRNSRTLQINKKIIFKCTLH
ncbi:unnamed protein product [Diamesa serratosioi]